MNEAATFARPSAEAQRAIEPRAHAQVLAPRVEPEDLVALDAAELEPEAVGAHVDHRERGRRDQAWKAAHVYGTAGDRL